MFRKLISNIAFSPALVGQLSFYAKRLRKEEATRRLGLIFTALALVVQSFAVFQPPESANAASANDFISGGVTSKSQLLSHYDRNTNNFKSIMSSLGITRAELVNTKAGTVSSSDGVYSWGHQAKFGAAKGEGSHSYKMSNGNTGKVYYRPLSLWGPATYGSYVGYSKKFGGWFAILKNCANLATKKPPASPPKPKPQPPKPKPTASCVLVRALVTDRTNLQLSGEATTSGGASIKAYKFTVKDSSGKTITTKRASSSSTAIGLDGFRVNKQGKYTATMTVETSVGDKTAKACNASFNIAAPEVCAVNPKLPIDSPECQPCPGTPSLWIKDETCRADILKTKYANNISQKDIDATTTLAKASDKIAYKLNVKNVGTQTTTVELSDNLGDVLDYATLIDAGNGKYDEEAKTITWEEITLKPSEEQSRIYMVQLESNIAAMPQGYSDRDSYNCKMTNTFGNTTEVNVDCPAVKQVEEVVTKLPHTGVTENMIFAGTVFAIVTYFYARSRQMKKEVRLIRRDLNSGTI